MLFRPRNEATEHKFLGAHTIKTFENTMPIEYSITVRVAYCVEIEAPEDGYIDWIKTLERFERFAESYGNDDGEAKRSAKRARTVPSGDTLFALAAQAVPTDNEGLKTALPDDTKEDAERIREIYPILVRAGSSEEADEDEDGEFMHQADKFRAFLDQTDRFKTVTSKVLGKILGRDDHGLEFYCIGHSHETEAVAKLVLCHEIPFQDSWFGNEGVKINIVPLSLRSVEPTVGVSMARILSVLGMKAVDEPGWRVVSDHYHEHF